MDFLLDVFHMPLEQKQPCECIVFIPEKWKTIIIQPLPNIPLPKGIHFNYKAYSISILPDLSSFETLLVGQMVSYINNVHMYTAEGSVWFQKTS